MSVSASALAPAVCDMGFLGFIPAAPDLNLPRTNQILLEALVGEIYIFSVAFRCYRSGFSTNLLELPWCASRKNYYVSYENRLKYTYTQKIKIVLSKLPRIYFKILIQFKRHSDAAHKTRLVNKNKNTKFSQKQEAVFSLPMKLTAGTVLTCRCLELLIELLECQLRKAATPFPHHSASGYPVSK